MLADTIISVDNYYSAYSLLGRNLIPQVLDQVYVKRSDVILKRKKITFHLEDKQTNHAPVADAGLD